MLPKITIFYQFVIHPNVNCCLLKNAHGKQVVVDTTEKGQWVTFVYDVREEGLPSGFCVLRFSDTSIMLGEGCRTFWSEL
jgi:hypothetical protein